MQCSDFIDATFGSGNLSKFLEVNIDGSKSQGFNH